MRIDFRIDWGYIYLYSRRHYHPFFKWDGQLDCTNGKIVELRKLDYPVIWYGPGHCAKETPLAGNSWTSTTRRGLSGIRVIADVEENAVFKMSTLSGDFEFSAADILDHKRIVFDVGPKYLNCHVIVTLTGHFWFQGAPRPNEKMWHADDLALPCHDWARIRTAWLAPGEKVTVTADIPEAAAETDTEYILHLTGMVAPGYTPGDEQVYHDEFEFTISVDGTPVTTGKHYFREHDTYMQMLEDVWFRFPCQPGQRQITLANEHKSAFVLINRLSLMPSVKTHLQLSLPKWSLTGEEIIGRIYARYSDHTVVRLPGQVIELDLTPGWNEFRFTLTAPGQNIKVTTEISEAVIDAVYALNNETPEVMVGFDMTVVPHDNNGFMDWLLDYTWRTRLGNIVVFRSFIKENTQTYKNIQIAPEPLSRWSNFCRTHHIYVEAATDFDNGALVAGAGEMLHSVGRHEWPGAVYAFDPADGWKSSDMKEAMENYLRHLKIEVDRAHKAAPRAAFGDASGGHRYCYMAGADFLRTETMVPHTQHLCSQARPAAEVFRDGEWGVHIAIHHAVMPYFYNHLRIYFLSIFQPWMMGANMIYEEDSLFQLFKEERQAWDDALTKGKRDMTREFYRFVKTHPRKGRQLRKIAFLEGRYAAPFNGFICDVEQTPDYSVWGKFGNDAPEWGHRQPEKCRQILDVLMPGANTMPLRQDYDKRRFFFSGTPYGDFDEVPVEAKKEYFNQYSLLLNLGWNTCIAEDYEMFKGFVANGGTLFTGLPQFSTHIRREFLRDMNDLALWNNGDLSDLCGFKVNGRSDVIYRGHWNCIDRQQMPAVELSAIPSDNPEEDGPCHLADISLTTGKVLIWDADSGLPLVVENTIGKGKIYTITAYAYPGHEKLQQLAAAVTAVLAAGARGDIYVEDDSREVYWSLWQESAKVHKLYLLNTDWTTAGNSKEVTVVNGEFSAKLTVTEGLPGIVLLLPGKIVEVPAAVHAEVTGYREGRAVLRICGVDDGKLTIHTAAGSSEAAYSFNNNTETRIEL